MQNPYATNTKEHKDVLYTEREAQQRQAAIYTQTLETVNRKFERAEITLKMIERELFHRHK